MYLEHFKLDEFPFTLTPNTLYYCGLPSHHEALNVLLISLRSGEGFIKIVGEVGTGKTLLCRLLLEYLEDDYFTAYIHNPDHSPQSLRLALANELGLNPDRDVDQHTLLRLINERLLELHQQDKQVVLLLDEAQAMTYECLEALRLLTNLETKSKKLMQVVLFAQPELDAKLNTNELRQLKQRITFAYQLKPINFNELNAYLCHRLAKAGHTYGGMFTPKARRFLYKSSRGLPRLINILCHKALMVAYGRGDPVVSHQSMLRAIYDTPAVYSQYSKLYPWLWLLLVGGVVGGLWLAIFTPLFSG